MVEQTAAYRRIGDSFVKPSAAVELELAELERWTRSAAWLAAGAALGLGRIEMGEMMMDPVGKYGTIA